MRVDVEAKSARTCPTFIQAQGEQACPAPHLFLGLFPKNPLPTFLSLHSSTSLNKSMPNVHSRLVHRLQHLECCVLGVQTNQGSFPLAQINSPSLLFVGNKTMHALQCLLFVLISWFIAEGRFLGFFRSKRTNPS